MTPDHERNARALVSHLVLIYAPAWGSPEESAARIAAYTREIALWGRSARDLSIAAQACKRELKWMPALSELYARLPNATVLPTRHTLDSEAVELFDHIRAQEALMLVNRCKGECWRSLDKLEAAHGRAARKAASCAGGLERIASVPDQYLHIVRGQFVAAYGDIVEEHHGEHRALPGAQPMALPPARTKTETEVKLDVVIGIEPGEGLRSFREMLRGGGPKPETKVDVNERMKQLREQADKLKGVDA